MSDLDPVAFERALGAFKRKMDDINSNYPTEDPREGGGPVGYAITAYLDVLNRRAFLERLGRKKDAVKINFNSKG